jgi:hypothetical protein
VPAVKLAAGADFGLDLKAEGIMLRNKDMFPFRMLSAFTNAFRS